MMKLSENLSAKLEIIGGKLQRSAAVSLLMILMVFAASVFLLLVPSQGDLPILVEGARSPQDVEAECDFTYQNSKEKDRYFRSFALEFPRYFRLDPARKEKMTAGYGQLMKEILRRNASEEEHKPYNTPENADGELAELVSFVREMPPLLFNYLRQTALDEARMTKAAGQVEEIVIGGIASEEELKKAQIFAERSPDGDEMTAVNVQLNAKILDLELREVGPLKLGRIPTPRIAAEQTVDVLLSAVSASQRPAYEKSLFDFFRRLYAGGNLTYDDDLTVSRLKEEYEAVPKTEREPEILYKKDTILIQKRELVTKEKFELFQAYSRAYAMARQARFTGSNIFQKIMLVALLVVFSCIYIGRVHPELIGNNRSIWLIGFIVIFSIVCDRVSMELYNDVALSGGYPIVPLYLAMPLALPAMVIAVIYSGRAAVFAGLFVSGVSAVALDLSFPAFVSGLFVCAVCTAAVRGVYDYKKFFTASFFSCTITMMLSSLIFRQSPDCLTIVRERMWNLLGFSLAVPLTAGLLTASLALVLVIALETVLDVTSNMSYLSLTDRNHPLLKQLQMEAPGTYHHSERVALLAEEAANSVGAMSLKVQSYALFHDVGKLASPEMFTENAHGKDMFKGILPEKSAEIIRHHVEYGVQLARKYKLKTPLRRAIECHHGNDFISFFYEEEKKRTGTIPPEEPFRYPGPLPQELEVVILMLADCCEAAVCSMEDTTEENVRALVEKIFNGKIQRKQLDASHITLEQLTRIRESFLKTLKSMNHTRISYSRVEEKLS